MTTTIEWRTDEPPKDRKILIYNGFGELVIAEYCDGSQGYGHWYETTGWHFEESEIDAWAELPSPPKLAAPTT
jgi:hypothetical protein